MTLFSWLTVAAAGAVVLAAAIARGRTYATFAAVLLGLQSAVAIALAPHFEWCFPLYYYLQAALLIHFALLIRARMRPLVYRALVSIPASFFLAGTLLAIPWGIAAFAGFNPWGAWIPFVVALVGVVQSLRHRFEVIDIALEGEAVATLRRHPRGAARTGRPLRIVQITDPHLGVFMSMERLRGVCERAVAKNPDVVFLTGDFLTMESHGDHMLLAHALAPLAALPGRVFACRGNHDHEAPETVAAALSLVGAKLLIDDAAEIDTPAGPIQIVGMDFAWRNRKERMAQVCAEHPRQPGRLRVILLHDPGAFQHLGEGEGDLVLSGHTHGGQLGLLSLGLPYTVVSAFGGMPDHGLWARGTDRLYVHRGTGHYGFPLRLGVPAEESLLCVHFPKG